MDTGTAKRNVDAEIAVIKASMPRVYAAIKLKADQLGKGGFELVRRGLRGEPNCFYAIEGGHVMGTPFSVTDIMDVTAKMMVQFGCSYVCIFSEAVDGTH